MEPTVETTGRKGARSWWLTTLLVLFLLTFGGIYSLLALGRAHEWVTHTDEVRVVLADLQSILVDAESGMRGYAVAGDPTFLDASNGARSAWEPRFDRLRTLTRDNPRQEERLDQLGALLRERFVLLDELRSARQNGRQGSELTAVMNGGGRATEQIRKLIHEMDQEESHLEDARQRDALNRWRWTMVLFIGGAFAFSLVVFTTSLRRREAEVRRLRAEEVSRASELFRIVLQGTDLGVTVQDPSGRLVYANDAAARLVGFTAPSELLAAPPAELLARFDLLTFEGEPVSPDRLPGRAVLQGSVAEEMRLRFKVLGTMEERWSVVRAVPARDLAGKVIYAINFFRDVTEEIREGHQRAFLLRAVDEMSSSLDYEKTLATVARLAVPVLADWCAIDLVDRGTRRRLAVAHVDPAKLEFVAELERRYPPNPQSRTGVPEILRTGKAELISHIPRELLTAAAIDEEHLRLIDQLQLGSYIGVPLKVRGQVIGALTIVMAESNRRYSQRDLELAQALADRSALAIDNARMFGELETARALATTQRDQSEERFRLMVGSVKDYAIFMLDPQGIVTTWNAGAQLIKGYRPEEIIGRHFSCFYSKEEVLAGKCERELAIATREGRFEEEGWRVRKDGSLFWANVVITAVRDAQARLRGFAKVTRDLTERRRSEGALALEARRRLEAENQTRFAETFIGILGHDLRNPLNAISIGAALIKRKGIADDRVLERILQSSERMSNMVGQLLDLTRTRLAGGIPIEKRPAGLRALVAGVIEELQLVYRDRDIRLETAQEIDGWWDTDRLAQVVSNLVGNALEHGQADKPITVRLSVIDDIVRFSVHSFGPPIPPEVLPMIFDPYRRTTARSGRSKGLGLGLFITQQIVLAHGGRLDCQSTDQDGTTLTVLLPRDVEGEVSSPSEALVS
ncbi:MAG TPA: CHASE3 domain-containing protein [Polyangia bacterium]|nr:CHASE3 domain-containing protein [Polyangia bacterium]